MFCAIPDAGCASISPRERDCANGVYFGCQFNVDLGVCEARVQCTREVSKRDCGWKSITYEATLKMLPGCLEGGSPEECEHQRARVYAGLEVEKDCGTGLSLPSFSQPILPFVFNKNESDINLYVDPQLGRDQSSAAGTRLDPFQSLDYAVERSRAFPSRTKRIVLLKGTHRLISTVLLTNKDEFLTIEGEKGAVISGSQLVDNVQWRQHDASILVTDITPRLARLLGPLSALFVDGVPMIRARFPNIAKNTERKYSTFGLRSWKTRPLTGTPLTNRKSLTITPGRYGKFYSAQGGRCSGQFSPDVGYFCEPSNEAQGGCFYSIPGEVTITKDLAQPLRASEWKTANSSVYIHVFHPYKWGLWTFDMTNQVNGNSNPLPPPQTTNLPDLRAWQELYLSTNGDAWTNCGFSFYHSPCDCKLGVRCRKGVEGRREITHILLPNNNLTGFLTSELISRFENLQEFDFGNNDDDDANQVVNDLSATLRCLDLPSCVMGGMKCNLYGTGAAYCTPQPTFQPSKSPTQLPTQKPSLNPTFQPSKSPTQLPSQSPTRLPSLLPTKLPTSQSPSTSPSRLPTKLPTSQSPSNLPSLLPTAMPSSLSPSLLPTVLPTQEPTSLAPTNRPSKSPTLLPTQPTLKPSTWSPTTAAPSQYPTKPTRSPSFEPTTLSPTTLMPTQSPQMSHPTQSPSMSVPTTNPTTSFPTTQPTTSVPSRVPSHLPSKTPTVSLPTRVPTVSLPTFSPSVHPTTSLPTQVPTTSLPTFHPSKAPTFSRPTHVPTTSFPTKVPTTLPSKSPTQSLPTRNPTFSLPTFSPSETPTSSIPTQVPTTSSPSQNPSKHPTSSYPTNHPSSSLPSFHPTHLPSQHPTTSRPTKTPTTSLPTRVPTTAPSRVPTTSRPSQSPSSSQPSISPSTMAPTPPTPCRIPDFVDVVFVVDASASVRSNFQYSINFMLEFAQKMSSSSRMGFLLVSGEVKYSPGKHETVGAYLLPSGDIKYVSSVVSALMPEGGTQNIGGALNFVRTAMFTEDNLRPGSKRIVILITGGLPTDTTGVSTPTTVLNMNKAISQLMKEDSVVFVGVRVGPSLPVDFLIPLVTHLYDVSSYAALTEELETQDFLCIHISQQPTTVSPTPLPTPPTTYSPSKTPTFFPTLLPSRSPRPRPTFLPTMLPTAFPSREPTVLPTQSPSGVPTVLPTQLPTFTHPSQNPSTSQPSQHPSTSHPSKTPSTSSPTVVPTTSRPSTTPTAKPSRLPTVLPTASPSGLPTFKPTQSPSWSMPSVSPTKFPSQSPSKFPTLFPTARPTEFPTDRPTRFPSERPSRSPKSRKPTTSPVSSRPSRNPTKTPTSPTTLMPSVNPTVLPSESPTILSTPLPTGYPTKRKNRMLDDFTPSPTGLDDISGANSFVDVPLTLYRGGFQEARGDCGNGGGNEWFVENSLSLLNSPGEYFVDIPNLKLYLFPLADSSFDPKNSRLELTSLRTLIKAQGTSPNDPLEGITFRKLHFTHTYATHMDDNTHEVPSGGDWTVTRQGALVLENVKDFVVEYSRFSFLGGNGLFVSKFAKLGKIFRNDFDTIDSSAVLLVGDPLFDSDTAHDRRLHQKNHVELVDVRENVMSVLGSVVKQSSGVFLSIAKSISLERNVVFDCTRAGFTFNDNFGGNTTVYENIWFHTVLETLDHGPLNMWDRQQWLEPPNKIWLDISRNLAFGNLEGPKGIDLDDGVRNIFIRDNVVLDGMIKLKGNDLVYEGNLLFPNDLGCYLLTPLNLPDGASNIQVMNNTCITAVNNLPPFYFNVGASEAKKMCELKHVLMKSNQHLGTRDSFSGCGVSGSMSWQSWTRTYKQDAGSVFSPNVRPPLSEQEALILQKLSWLSLN